MSQIIKTFPKKKPLILIVDDVPKNIQVLAGILNKENYHISASVNGKQAITMAENILPDLILLDIMMPETDGFEACKSLKQIEKTKDIPIIFLTAKTETQDIVKGFQLGAVDYVTKPFNATELLARVHTHLELKNARDRLCEKTKALTKANYQLRERQNLIVQLLGDISKIRFSGDRHAIRNFAQKVFENEKNKLVQSIANQIYLAYHLLKEKEKFYLISVCKSFGITQEIIDNQNLIENKLHQIIIERKTDDYKKENEVISEFLGDIFSQDIDLDKAYSDFKEIMQQYKNNTDSPLSRFDPFVLFYTLRDFRDITDEINKRFSEYGKMQFLDNILFSQALKLARHQATAEKELPLEIEEDLKYDPCFNTNKDALIFMLRDILYNAIDAGATQVKIAGRRPSSEEDLPYYKEYDFEDYPSFYLLIEDKGKGILQEKANQLNAYINGKSYDDKGLSDKQKGGLGTKNLRDFLYLHRGTCHYEPCQSGTKIHIYFEKLEI